MSDWPYPYCPHQSYNKNLQIRLASIPYTFVPDHTIDSFANVNIKCGNLNKYNIPTLAYEDYFNINKQSNDDRHFAKDYYLDKNNEKPTKLDNDIVNEKKEQMTMRNAYVLAADATQSYNKLQTLRKSSLLSGRQRSVTTYKSHFAQLAQDKLRLQKQNAQWIKKLYRKLQEIAKHIVQGQGDNNCEKQKLFILSKGNITATFLSQINIRNAKCAFQILQELRVLMLKKKLTFQNQRQQQQKNKSVAMSYTSQVQQNTSQDSIIYEETSVNKSNIKGEDYIVAKYCDFDCKKKKWNVQHIQEVKYLLRKVLTNKCIAEAEVTVVKNKKQEQQISKSLTKLHPQANKKRHLSTNKTTKQQLRSKSVNILKGKNTKQQEKFVFKLNISLNKQELLIKQKLLKGGQFDAFGQKFARNNNYSSLFAKKEKQINFQYSSRQLNEKQVPKISRIGKTTNQKLQSTLNLSNS